MTYIHIKKVETQLRLYFFYENTLKLFLLMYLQRLLDFRREDINALFIVTANGNDNVRQFFSRFDKGLVHGLDVGAVMTNGLVQTPAPLVDITLNDTYQTLIGFSIHKYFQIQCVA